MSEASRRRRILVCLDLSAGSLAAAELTAELASALGAEVCGLFVEEEQLLVLAAHPLVREVDTWSAADREIDTARLERRMRAQAGRARQLLARLAQRRGVPWTFQTVRGPATAAIRQASNTADIVTLGRVGWSPGGKGRLGGTARAILIEAERAVLIPGAQAPPGAPIVACFDGTDAGERAFEIAAELAGRTGAKLIVETIGDEAARPNLQARIAEIAAAAGLPAPQVEATDVAHLAESLRSKRARLIVLGRDGALEGAAIANLAVELTSPVLVIRSALPRRESTPSESR